ncbi:UNC45-central domain-containing protein [Phanerochaete sordida]|uniref:UNC45-central domain-containing protein n=1 Tax=Phanerochaete sordida TaxID=48140 RepID=A0A9P3G7P0_9APHY|nr:UNC45-central domain-containing protein [Phanerochaete sordida]
MATEAEAKLDTLLKHTQDKAWTPLPDEITVLVDAFSPSNPHSLRTKAYVVLAATCQRLREGSPSSKAAPDAATQAIVRPLSPTVTAKLSDTSEDNIVSGLSFVAALFQVDWESASAILQRDGVLESVVDAVDTYPSSLPIARAAAQLVAQASGHKACRALIPQQCVEWLESKAKRSQDSILRAAAAVALVKLSQGATADAAATAGADKAPVANVDEDLVSMMKGLVVSNDASTSLNDSVEGLAYMSINPTIKEQLSRDTQFLQKLFAIVPRRKADASQSSGEGVTSPVYGVVAIIANICAYRPKLSEEEAQIAKLRRMASSTRKDGEPEVDPLEDDEHAKARGKRLLQAGVLDALTAAVRVSDSRAVRLAAGKAILSLVEDQENRGRVLQAGGGKALINIIQGLLPPASKKGEKEDQAPSLNRADLECIQALAKLAITASPIQVFGPNEGALYDAIRPFAILSTHPNSTLLQRFEAIMALTNLASQSPEVATRIANASGLLNKVELLMLEDHALIRRAATELVCNLIAGSEEIFSKYGGDESSASKSKLHVLVALCDVDDTPTRLAASGALAMLTSAPHACQLLLELEREKHKTLSVLGQLIDPSIKIPYEGEEDEPEEREISAPDPGLVHRGAAVVRNWLAGVDTAARKELGEQAQEIGLGQALVRLFRAGGGSPALMPAAEALKLMLDAGVPVTA